jgi:membrane protease YdiL (CAAX protease family)
VKTHCNSRALLTGLYIFLFTALLEETLFRGFIFQRLLDGVGFWPAQIALATLFAVAHWGSPGMQGATEIVAFMDIFLAAVMLGLAYLRTRSLALPIGLHDCVAVAVEGVCQRTRGALTFLSR